MQPSDVANRPRWRGTPGFFEIWFLVVFAPRERRAWWLRFTTFAPVVGPPRATLWAAAFDAGAARPAVALKQILPIEAYDGGPADRFAVRIGEATLTNESTSGAVAAGARRIAWDLRFTPARVEALRGPWLLHHLPLPTRVAHANSDIRCHGTVTVDGVRHALDGAPGVQKHIWGTRRVEELYWLYCPGFDGDAEARLEATAARLDRVLPGGVPAPYVTTVWLRTADGTLDRTGLAALFANRVAPAAPGGLALRSTSATRLVEATARCDPRTLAAWVYRDPGGRDLYIAQSDVASCTVEMRTRPHPLASWGPAQRLECRAGAALEFHAPEPLAGVRYLGWDETELSGA